MRLNKTDVKQLYLFRQNGGFILSVGGKIKI
jgi:hypothetical protein